jgi:hypothetical protein
MVDPGSGSQREVADLMLTRYACYLIAQNGAHHLRSKRQRRTLSQPRATPWEWRAKTPQP